MRTIVGLLAVSLPAFAGYGYKAQVVFAPASGSTQNNITLAFTFNDAKLRTVANGGQIQNTVARVGVTVPADFVLTNDTSCASLTGGWTWGIETYSPTAGTGIGWAKVASLPTGAAVTPTVCIGNTSVTTYQGGAQGAEFDAATLAVYHLADGTTLSGKDSGAAALDGTVSGAVAVGGKIDGAVSTNGATGYISLGAFSAVNGAAAVTVEMWIQPNSATSYGMYFTTGGAYEGTGNIEIRNFGGSLQPECLIRNSGGSVTEATPSATVPTGVWTHYACVYDGATVRIYYNGIQQSLSGGGSLTGALAASSATSYIGRRFDGLTPDASIDEVHISAAGRPSDRIATEYANQSNPPAIGPFTAVTSAFSQVFVF